MATKEKGLAILLGLGKPKPDSDSEDSKSEDGASEALKDAGSNLLTAIKGGDSEGVAQAILDIVDLG
jgi:hypothetical protein